MSNTIISIMEEMDIPKSSRIFSEYDVYSVTNYKNITRVRLKMPSEIIYVLMNNDLVNILSGTIFIDESTNTVYTISERMNDRISKISDVVDCSQLITMYNYSHSKQLKEVMLDKNDDTKTGEDL